MALFVAYCLSPALARLVIPQTYLAWSSFHGWEGTHPPNPQIKAPSPQSGGFHRSVRRHRELKSQSVPEAKKPNPKLVHLCTCALVHLLEGTLFRNRNTCTLEHIFFVYTVKCAAVIITKEMPHDSNQFWNNYKGRIRIVRYWKRILKSSNNWFFSWTPAAGWSVKIQCVYCLFSPKLKAANNLLKRSSLVFCKFSKYFLCF